MEATSNHLCANGSDSTGKHPCFINVWIVDQAAESVLHLSSTRLLLDITITLESTNNTSWCVRIIDPVSQDSSQDLLIGDNCPSIQSDRSRTAAASLRKWLGSPQARQQIPAHLSDAWRLVAGAVLVRLRRGLNHHRCHGVCHRRDWLGWPHPLSLGHTL